MTFTGGDYIAICAIGVSVAAFGLREWRGKITDQAQRASDDTRLEQILKGVIEKVEEAVGEIRNLEQKRQKHEVDCARIQERTAAAQQRTAEILTEHSRSIGSLQGQMRHVATGSANKIIEITGEG